MPAMLPHPARGVNAFVAFVARAGLDECVSCDAQRCTPATSPVYGFGMPPRKKPADPTLAVAYLRVSTDDQKLGPEIQRDQIGRWAAANGVTVLSWHFDEGVSGGTAIEKRLAAHGSRESQSEKEKEKERRTYTTHTPPRAPAPGQHAAAA